jgi:hypothetical protein
MGETQNYICVLIEGVRTFMRRSPFVRTMTFVVSAAASLSIFASTISLSSAAVAPPAKSKTTRSAKPAKSPKLAGEVVESEALDMRMVIPEGWEPFNAELSEFRRALNR